MGFEKVDVLACCAQFGPGLVVPRGIDGPTLMAAIASNESSFGANCGPRHEPAYDVGGAYSKNPQQAALLQAYGTAAACSYGPWQVMLVNCGGRDPDILLGDLDENAKAFVGYFNSYVAGKRPQTIEQIGQIFNGGHIFSGPAPDGVQRYTDNLQAAYNLNPMGR